MDRKPIYLAFLLSRWSVNTHTFVAAWGEFSSSLEDVTLLIGLPVFGNVQVLDFLNEEGKARVPVLGQVLL